MKGDHVGEFEELVLLAVRALAGVGHAAGSASSNNAYGVSVVRLLSRETSREVSIGAVYAALDRLEAKGLVRSEMTAGEPTRGGRSRRAFTITPDGSHTLSVMSRVRDRLWRSAGGRAARGRT